MARDYSTLSGVSTFVQAIGWVSMLLGIGGSIYQFLEVGSYGDKERIIPMVITFAGVALFGVLLAAVGGVISLLIDVASDISLIVEKTNRGNDQ